MSSRVIGHEEQRRRLAEAWKSGRLAHAYLFVGPSGIGKRTFARRFAQAVLCRNPDVESLEPCGQCGCCNAFDAGGHPDYFEAAMEADRHEFRIEVIRNLLPKLSLKPALGTRRVAVVDDVDRLNDEAANAFLKTLEEPPPGSLLLLIASGVEALLPTIRSRCQSVRFSSLAVSETAEVLLAAGLAETPEAANRVAESAGGSISEASDLANPEWLKLKSEVERRLAEPTIDLVHFAKVLNKYCEDGVKEAAEKRRRALQVVRGAIQLYECSLQVKTAGGATANDSVALATQLPEAALLDSIERTLEADEQIRRYLHLPTTIDCWIDDLAQIAAGAYAPS